MTKISCGKLTDLYFYMIFSSFNGDQNLVLETEVERMKRTISQLNAENECLKVDIKNWRMKRNA